MPEPADICRNLPNFGSPRLNSAAIGQTSLNFQIDSTSSLIPRRSVFEIFNTWNLPPESKADSTSSHRGCRSLKHSLLPTTTIPILGSPPPRPPTRACRLSPTYWCSPSSSIHSGRCTLPTISIEDSGKHRCDNRTFLASSRGIYLHSSYANWVGRTFMGLSQLANVERPPPLGEFRLLCTTISS